MQRELKALRDRPEVAVRTISTENFTLVRATFWDGIIAIGAEGIARLSHMDKWNPTIGVRIAEGRALKALQKKLAGKPVKNLFMA